jgi:hypothetical protein
VKRFELQLPGYETAEVQKVGDVVRFEIHSDAATVILDFTRHDARMIADALHAACHRDLWQTAANEWEGWVAVPEVRADDESTPEGS